MTKEPKVHFLTNIPRLRCSYGSDLRSAIKSEVTCLNCQRRMKGKKERAGRTNEGTGKRSFSLNPKAIAIVDAVPWGERSEFASKAIIEYNQEQKQ